MKYGVPVPNWNPTSFSKAAKRDNEIFTSYMQVLYRAYQICCERRTNFDFTDMVYLPVRLGLPLIQYDVVLIDESQDLNAVQIEMIRRSVHPERGRIIFVGDKNQAIYGFRGADTHAIETLTHEFNTQKFPLHTCWRCPQSVIGVAQQIVRYISARPGAEMGISALHQQEDDILEMLRQRNQQLTHLVLCRTNAPLIMLAMQLVQLNVSCYIQADALRNALLRLLDQLVNRSDWIKAKALLQKIEQYRIWKKDNLKELGGAPFSAFGIAASPARDHPRRGLP